MANACCGPRSALFENTFVYVARWSRGMILALGIRICERSRVQIPDEPNNTFYFVYAPTIKHLLYQGGAGIRK